MRTLRTYVAVAAFVAFVSGPTAFGLINPRFTPINLMEQSELILKVTFGPVKDSHLVMTAARFDHVAPPRRPQVRQGVRKDQHVQSPHAVSLLISATLAIRVLHPLVMRNSSPPSRRPAYPRPSVSVSALGASWSP